jgi:hypothetical protein
MQSAIVEVLQHTNKLWQRRLNVVLSMEVWMAANLSPYVSGKDGAVVRRSRTDRVEKGREYLYCHLLLGKTLCPEGGDPLFTDEDFWLDRGGFKDISLQKQLDLDEKGSFRPASGLVGTNVTAFLREISRLKRSMFDGVGTDSAPAYDIVRGTYVRGSAVHVIRDLESAMSGRFSPDVISEHMIGLILRYRCIGGFHSNQHASIQRGWRMSFPNMIECFASPLNHVFDDYFSVFEEDRVFGGKGNLLLSIKDGALPTPAGRLEPYDVEMNPPFEETILDKAADIVCKTFAVTGCVVRLVMFVPNWTDSDFFRKLDQLTVDVGPRYAVMEEKRIRYENARGGAPPVDSLMFIFVGSGCTAEQAAAFTARCREVMHGSLAFDAAARGWGGGERGRGGGERGRSGGERGRVVSRGNSGSTEDRVSDGGERGRSGWAFRGGRGVRAVSNDDGASMERGGGGRPRGAYRDPGVDSSKPGLKSSFSTTLERVENLISYQLY